MTRSRIVLVALAVGATAVGGTVSAQGSSHEYVVVMDNMNFGRMPAGLKVGDTIVWSNQDTVQHSATARDGSFDVRLQPGKQAKTVLKNAGTLNLYCIFHSMMRTSVKVAAG